MRMWPVMSFIYPATRIQARSELQVDDKKIKSLMDFKSVSEFANALMTTEYADEVQKLQDKSDTKMLHSALEKGYLGAVENVQKLSPENTQKIIDAYVMFQEAKLLKTVYRSRLTETEVDETLVFPVGHINYSLLNHLLKTESIADLGVVMETTVYSKVFGKKYEKLEEFEVELDNFVFHNFLRALDKSKFMDKKVVKDMFKLKMDVQNMLALIRFHVRDVPVEKRKGLLIRNKGTEMERFIDPMVKAEDINEICKIGNPLPYSQLLDESNKIYNNTGSLLPFEIELMRYFKNKVKDISKSYPMSSVVIFSYLIEKEIEKRNLFAISKGIERGIKSEEIQELII